jgi:hypothetical protein
MRLQDVGLLRSRDKHLPTSFPSTDNQPPEQSLLRSTQAYQIQIEADVFLIDTDSVKGLDDQQFNFIVVGGRTSGLAVANRLTEDPNTSVLVLESGSNHLDDERLLILGLALSVHQDPEFDWDFWSVPRVSPAIYVTFSPNLTGT